MLHYQFHFRRFFCGLLKAILKTKKKAYFSLQDLSSDDDLRSELVGKNSILSLQRNIPLCRFTCFCIKDGMNKFVFDTQLAEFWSEMFWEIIFPIDLNVLT